MRKRACLERVLGRSDRVRLVVVPAVASVSREPQKEASC